MGEKETQVKDFRVIGRREVTLEGNEHKGGALVLMLGEEGVRPGQSPGVSHTASEAELQHLPFKKITNILSTQ